jgi:hypothetical protein
MDFVTAQDMDHRAAMERGSKELLDAITWARKGFNPGTSAKPLKLPPDGTNRRSLEVKALDEKRPSNEIVREMIERGLKPKEIARELKISVQKAVVIAKTIKLQRRRDDFEERINQRLWG